MLKFNFRTSLLNFSIRCTFFLSALSYADHTASASAVQFVQNNQPPPGFESSSLDISQSNYVSVYYGNQFLGNVMATYNDNTVEFQGLGPLVNKIPGVKDQQSLIQALSGSLPNNQEHLCPQDNNPQNLPYCTILTPDIAGVIFDANNYRATIFINPNQLNAIPQTVKISKLPDSTAGFSYLGANNAAVSTSSGQQTYSFNNQSFVADGNTMLNMQSNFTQTNSSPTSGGSTASSTAYNVQSVALSRLKNGIYYQAGMITPYTGNFISGQTILGASIQNYGVIPEQAQGTPLQIFLPLPAQVAIYKNAYLISTQNFDAGKQLIDTSNFPNGSYTIQLKITNSLGQVTTQTQFFVKQPSLPPSGRANYQISLGLVQSNQNNTLSNGIILPSFLQNPFFDYTEMRKLWKSFGLQSTLVSNFNRVFLSEALNYYGANLQLSPGVLVSNNQQYGWLFNANFTPQKFPNFSLSSNNQKIIASKTVASNANILSGSNFSPLSQTTFQSNNLANLSIGQKTSVSANYQVTQNAGQASSTQYGINLSRNLISTALFSLQVTGSLTKATGNNTTIIVALSAGFYTANNLSVVLGGGVDNTTQIDNLDNNTVTSRYEANYNARLTKNYYWGANRDSNLGVIGSINHTYTTDTGNLSTYFNNELLSGNFNFAYNDSRTLSMQNNVVNSTNSSNWQTSGNVQNNVVYTHGHWAWGYQGASTSGLLLLMRAPDKNITADLLVNGQDTSILKANKTKAVFLSPYQSYSVTIEPKTMTPYGFDQSPKPVTLYNGNVQYLSWTLNKQYVLFAQLVDAQGQPLKDLLLVSKNSNDFNVTDEDGYIQANIDSGQSELQFKEINGKDCNVHLPPLQDQKTQEGLIVLKTPLLCAEESSASSPSPTPQTQSP